MSSGGRIFKTRLIRLVKEFIIDGWEVRKQKLYGEDICPSYHQCQILAGDTGLVTGGGGGLRVSKMAELQDKAKLGKFHVWSSSSNVHAGGSSSASGSSLHVALFLDLP